MGRMAALELLQQNLRTWGETSIWRVAFDVTSTSIQEYSKTNPILNFINLRFGAEQGNVILLSTGEILAYAQRLKPKKNNAL